MAVTSGSTGWHILNHNMSYKVDWQFVSFNYSEGTVTLFISTYLANRTSTDISYTTTGELFYLIFNDQSISSGGGSGETNWPAGFEDNIVSPHNITFNVPSNGDLSNVSIGLKEIENGVENAFTVSFDLPNFSNNFIKRNNSWYRAVPWLKVNGTWKRCRLWKKISGTWK